MKKKKFLIAALALTCAVTLSLGLAACDGDRDRGMGETAWGESIEAFVSEVGTTPEFAAFATHYKDFKYKDGKYTADEIPSADDFVCKNVVITVNEEGEVEGMTYELRTESKDTPDRLVTVDKNGISTRDIPKPSDNTQMDEEEWTEQVSIFADITNYSLDRVRVDNNEPVAGMKLNGTTYYETYDGGVISIWTVENSSHCRYFRASPASGWTKDIVSGDRYESAIGTPAMIVTAAAAAIQEDFASFSFNAGIYTKDEVTVDLFSVVEITLKDLEITVSGNRIVRAVCTLKDGYAAIMSSTAEKFDERITVDHIGSTVITLPETYTDNTVGQEDPDKGKKVDEGIWVKNFSALSNVTIGSHTTTATDSGTVTIETETKIDGNKMWQKTSGTNESELILVNEDDETISEYDYDSTSGTWSKKTASPDVAGVISGNVNQLMYFADQMENFNYSGGRYVCGKLIIHENSLNTDLTFTNVVIIFEDSALKEISFTVSFSVEGEGSNAFSSTNSSRYTDFGTTEVTVPTEYHGEG